MNQSFRQCKDCKNNTPLHKLTCHICLTNVAHYHPCWNEKKEDNREL